MNIIKNCPAKDDLKTADFDENGNLIEIGATFTDYCIKNKRYCKDITDCLLKQIEEKCKEQNLKYDTTACQILELLEIEECENDD